MKKLSLLSAYFILLFSFGIAQSDGSDPYVQPGLKINFQICQSSGQIKALQERGETVTQVKDDLIRRTVRAYGGDYVRNDQITTIMLNGKTYKDFTVEVIEGKYLRIKTPGDTLYLDVVTEPSPQ